jgi:hypothetical protein
MNAQKGDEWIDLFPGTGIVGAAWAEWSGEHDAQLDWLDCDNLAHRINR